MHLQQIQPVLEIVNQYLYLAQMWWGYAKLSCARGNQLQARELYEHILSLWKTTQDAYIILPILLDGMLFHIDAGNRTKARQWQNELHMLMQVTDNPIGVAGLLHGRGALKAAEGNMEEAISLLREAVNVWRSVHWRYLQALAAKRLAEVLLAWARKSSSSRSMKQEARAEAEALLVEVLALYERLQIPTGVQAVHSLRTRTRLEAQQKRRSTLQSRQPLQRLTERESQVLQQLVAGQTNREIARTLNLSVGTVELHVSRILSKLHCKTRTQAAAYVLGCDLDNDQVTR